MQALYYRRRMINPRLEQKFHDRLFVPDYNMIFTIKNKIYTFSEKTEDLAEGLALFNFQIPKIGYTYSDMNKLNLDENRVEALINLFQRKATTERLIESTLISLLSKNI